MVRFIRLSTIDLIEASPKVLALVKGERIFLAFPDPEMARLFSEIGIPAEALDGEAPEGSVVILNERPLYDLVTIADRLLGPGGCPWDQAQTHRSLKSYLLEEAYEVLDAIDADSNEELCEELGDLMLQPVMHAQMKKLAGGFDIDEVATAIVAKLVRRHPHVFGNVEAKDAETVLRNWDAIKKAEKGGEVQSILGGLPKGAASLLRAYEISKRAARVGFEWPSIEAVFEKLREEETELKGAIQDNDAEAIESEIGDLLFTVVNISRWAKVEPEEALRKMVNRFIARFQVMESLAAEPLNKLSAEEWDRLWNEAKARSAKVAAP